MKTPPFSIRLRLTPAAAAALSGLTILAALIPEAVSAVTSPVRTIREASAPGPQAAAASGIQATVSAFQADLGTPNNGNAVGSQGTGQRQITWDGGDNDAAPARLPADFFNAIAPRGVIFGPNEPRIQFQVSADSTPAVPGTLDEFGNINATYPAAFSAFSPPRLFTSLTSNVIQVRFVIPGSLTPAGVSGFGAVFTDVDSAVSTKIEFFDTMGVKIFERFVLASPGNEGLSFLGVSFFGSPLGRVRITCGEAAPGANDVTQTPGNPDIVVMDDFIYGEPQPLEGVVGFSAGDRGSEIELRDGVSGGVVVNGEAFDTKTKKGVTTAVADVSGDGIPDLIVGSGPKAKPFIRVFDGVSGTQIRELLAFDEKFRGGVNVAAGNITGDASADIIAAQGKGPQVRVFDGASGTQIASFSAYEGKVKGGVRVAAGDINGDFLDDIVTAPGRGMDARVLAFDAVTLGNPSPSVLRDFIAAPGRKGVFIDVGDVSGDGILDFIVGNDMTAQPEVRVLDGGTLLPLQSIYGGFLAFPSNYKGGVRVAAADVNGNGTTDIIVGSGKGKRTTIRVFDPSGVPGGPLWEFLPFGPDDKRGVFIGAGSR